MKGRSGQGKEAREDGQGGGGMVDEDSTKAPDALEQATAGPEKGCGSVRMGESVESAPSMHPPNWPTQVAETTPRRPDDLTKQD